MTERDLLLDCLKRLNRIGIDYLLTGSMASNYWGIPRSTNDLDFVILLSGEDVTRVVNEFSGDFYVNEAAVRAAFDFPHQFNAIDTRSALKVDFWLLRPGPFDQEMFRRRMKIVLFGESAWIATPEDVVLHKLYWDGITPSERQVGDAAGVVAVQENSLDLDYLRRWAGVLGVAQKLEDILTGRIRPKTT